jgi:hypothetical protein
MKLWLAIMLCLVLLCIVFGQDEHNADEWWEL